MRATFVYLFFFFILTGAAEAVPARHMKMMASCIFAESPSPSDIKIIITNNKKSKTKKTVTLDVCLLLEKPCMNSPSAKK